MIRKVAVIPFSNRTQCLITTSFDIVPSVPFFFFFFLQFSLQLIQIFVFIILQYQKDDFVTKREHFEHFTCLCF